MLVSAGSVCGKAENEGRFLKSRPRLTAGGVIGCRAAGSCFPVQSGSVAGHGQLCLWALCSLVEQHCSTGGDSQAYQVKKKCLAAEGFSCWVRV
ncbi:unnamed protein product [Pleuronectes platessa]|uniref:Uncharacterized protein n=1 Tax=Pleuronectes platessa TaxID=8262 RepID=A0A9N7VIB3_PLEPL|nr:unnamed protein product [Pleuronectes platessa]